MYLQIHRGADQIGGSCVEIGSRDGTRLIIDAGMPLARPDGSEWPRGMLRQPLDTLRAEGVLPPIRGLFRDDEHGVAAVLLSHAHIDHYGIVHAIHPDIPVFGSAGTGRLLDISALFLPDAPVASNFHPIEENESLAIGPFSIRFISVDHPAPHSMALRIDADKQSIVYSGDLRGHGRNSPTLDRLAQAGCGADALILEGTTVGQESGEHGHSREQDVEDAMTEVMRAAPENFVVMIASAQNLDRAVTAWRATIAAGRELVVDAYQAYLLHELKEFCPGAPQYDSPGVRVKFTASHVERLKIAGKMDFVYRLARASKITSQEIAARPGRYLYLARGNDATARLVTWLASTVTTVRMSRTEIVWSLWRGYFDRPNPIATLCRTLDITPAFIHSGGHASPEDLSRLVVGMNPRRVVPMHTKHPELYASLFTRTTVTGDHECLNLDSP